MIAQMRTERGTKDYFFLDARVKSPRVQDFDEKLAARIVGQEKAVRGMSSLYSFSSRVSIRQTVQSALYCFLVLRVRAKPGSSKQQPRPSLVTPTRLSRSIAQSFSTRTRSRN